MTTTIMAVENGVQQGSVFGLLFFKIYVNDTVNVNYNLHLTFADELNLYNRY